MRLWKTNHQKYRTLILCQIKHSSFNSVSKSILFKIMTIQSYGYTSNFQPAIRNLIMVHLWKSLFHLYLGVMQKIAAHPILNTAYPYPVTLYWHKSRISISQNIFVPGVLKFWIPVMCMQADVCNCTWGFICHIYIRKWIKYTWRHILCLWNHLATDKLQFP